MAKDPAFLFYPGDYLRDTQCLSEACQVAYDRIMCEHMRNICISQAQLKFFTKRLSEDEIAELKSVLTENESGFFIAWVAESISKRKSYSESRAQNRRGKPKEHMSNISTSYVQHMENEIEIEIGIEKEKARAKKFTRPELHEVTNYMDERNVLAGRPWVDARIESEAKKLFDYYEANGWKVGRNPMKDWRAAVRNWITNSNTFELNGNKSHNNSTAPRGSRGPHHVTPEEAAAALHRLHQERDARSSGNA